MSPSSSLCFSKTVKGDILSLESSTREGKRPEKCTYKIYLIFGYFLDILTIRAICRIVHHDYFALINLQVVFFKPYESKNEILPTQTKYYM